MTTDLRQRQEPTRSRHYLDGAKGSACTLNITGVCTGNTETNVAAHIRDEHHGRSVKASDLSSCDSCQACHDTFDGRTHQPLTTEEWLFYALRALQRTLERRREQGRLIVRLDPERLSSERAIAPRKPREQRAKVPASANPIPQRENPWGPKGSRKFAQRQKVSP